MYTRYVFVILLCCQAFLLSAQHKIVFRDGMKRAVIKPGKLIGITEKGETYKYTNWKSVCSGCYYEGCMDSLYKGNKYFDSIYYYDRDCADTLCYQNQWILDSISKTHIVLRRFSDDSADYRYDTIAMQEMGRYEKRMHKRTDYFIVEEIVPPDSSIDNYRYVYAVALNYERKRVAIDSISSFTFSEAEKCSTFGLETPLLAAITIIGAPIGAAQEHPYSWELLLVGEAIGAYLVTAMYTNIQNLKVKTYETKEWKIKVK